MHYTANQNWHQADKAGKHGSADLDWILYFTSLFLKFIKQVIL